MQGSQGWDGIGLGYGGDTTVVMNVINTVEVVTVMVVTVMVQSWDDCDGDDAADGLVEDFQNTSLFILPSTTIIAA